MDFVDFSNLTDSSFFQLVVVPFLIFCARVTDVSLGTMRTVFVAQGTRVAAAVLGFFEILIWLTVITYIFQNLSGVFTYLAYAAGFSAGNYVGLWLEERMAWGLLSVTTITGEDANALIDHLKKERFGLTTVSARGARGRVRLILTIIRRRNLKHLKSIIEEFNPNAFISIQPVKAVSKGISNGLDITRKTSDLFSWRKGK
jgi:uncharacterized protein YebE (UPF0316 family)